MPAAPTDPLAVARWHLAAVARITGDVAGRVAGYPVEVDPGQALLMLGDVGLHLRAAVVALGEMARG